MKPYLDDGDVRLYHGEVVETLRALPAESIDCVVTSPPYWGLRDYGVAGQIGLEPTPQEFVARLVDVFREVRRVLAPHGCVFLNLGDSYLPNKQMGMIPARVALALQEPYYTGAIRSEVDRVWLAAMVEAEGCMFLHKRKVGQSNGQGYIRKTDSYGAGLEISSTDRVIVDRCLAITGLGSVCEQSPAQNERRKQTIYRWNLRSNVCRDVIRELYPHMIAKQHEARLLLGCPSSGASAEAAHESLKAIHQGGTPTIDFPAPAPLFEPGWTLRSDIIFSKPNPMPESVTDRPTKAHEYVFLLTKAPRYFWDAEAVREAHTVPEAMRRQRKTAGAIHAEVPERHAESYSGIVGNDRAYPEGGRNIRTVWEIATQPFPEAHFATFPEALVERCVKAGCPEHVCRECGEPRRRVVEVEYVKSPVHGAGSVVGRHDASGANGWDGSGMPRLNKSTTTTGWTDCGHDAYRPGVVLDPFVGSGTTALVTRNLGRHAVGIDLSAEYLAIAAKRLQQLSLLTGAA